jgi:hypothetical protein
MARNSGRMTSRTLVLLVLAFFAAAGVLVNGEIVSDRIVEETGNPALRGSLGFLEAGERARGGDGSDEGGEDNSGSGETPENGEDSDSKSNDEENEAANAVEEAAEQQKKEDGGQEETAADSEDNSDEGGDLEDMLKSGLKAQPNTKMSGQLPKLAKELRVKDQLVSRKNEKAAPKAAPQSLKSKKKRSPWADFVGSLEPTGVASKCTTTCRKSRKRKAQVCETFCEPIVAAEHVKPKNAL